MHRGCVRPRTSRDEEEALSLSSEGRIENCPVISTKRYWLGGLPSAIPEARMHDVCPAWRCVCTRGKRNTTRDTLERSRTRGTQSTLTTLGDRSESNVRSNPRRAGRFRWTSTAHSYLDLPSELARLALDCASLYASRHGVWALSLAN